MYDARLLTEFNDIVDHLANGWEIPDRYLPLGIGIRRDRLLDELGVKHLHLKSRGSDILLYLVEYPDRVELLEINTHVHLEDEPRGHLLGRLFGLRRT